MRSCLKNKIKTRKVLTKIHSALLLMVCKPQGWKWVKTNVLSVCIARDWTPGSPERLHPEKLITQWATHWETEGTTLIHAGFNFLHPHLSPTTFPPFYQACLSSSRTSLASSEFLRWWFIQSELEGKVVSPLRLNAPKTSCTCERPHTAGE